MRRQLACLVALARIGLRGLCFSGVVVFIAMQQLSLDVMDRATVGTAWLLVLDFALTFRSLPHGLCCCGNTRNWIDVDLDRLELSLTDMTH